MKSKGSKNTKLGKVYRRSDLSQRSGLENRNNRRLSEKGFLRKVSCGIYHKLKNSICCAVPADIDYLLPSFRKDNNYLIIHPDWYHGIGIGTTQLYKCYCIYICRRHGIVKLDNMDYQFILRS